MREALAAVTASLLLAATAGAQTQEERLDAYERVAAVVNGTAAYVGETLLTCAAMGALTEPQAEERFKSYQARNAATMARTEAWSRDAGARLRAEGVEREAGVRAKEAGLSAIAGSSQQAEGEIRRAPDARATCAARLAAIDAGAFDLARNPELLGLLGR